METIAIIPARSGSKRITDKNIVPINGKPALAFTVERALSCDAINRVYVSTDSNHYYSIATAAGAQCDTYMRPARLSGDFIGTIEVIQDYVSYLLGSSAISPDCLVVVLYPLALFASEDILNDAVSRYRRLTLDYDVDFMISAKAYKKNPFRAFVHNTGGLRMLFPEQYASRSQDLDPVLYDCGQFYVASASKWLSSTRIYTTNSVPYLFESDVIDVDTLEDLSLAQALL